MNKFKLLPLAMSAITTLALPLSVLAHEHQAFKIGNKTYDFTVGSLNEPISVDDRTGVDLRVKEVGGTMMEDEHYDESISHAEEGKPVTGLDQTLKVELIAGSQKKILDLSPAFNDPGAYRAVFFPTIQTTLTYRFFGTINNVPVDLSFTCNPAGHPQAEEDNTMLKITDHISRISKRGAFGCPVAKADLGFPEKSASLYDLNNRIADVPSTSRNLTILAMALGAAGIFLGIVVLLKRK